MHKRQNAGLSSQPKIDFGGRGGRALPVESLVKNSVVGLLSHPSVDFSRAPLSYTC